MKLKKCIIMMISVGLILGLNISAFGVELLKTVPYRINTDSSFSSADVSLTKNKTTSMSSNTCTVYTAGNAYGIMYKKSLFGTYKEYDYDLAYYSKPGQTRTFYFKQTDSSTSYRYALMAYDRGLNSTGLDMFINNVTVTK